MTTMPRTATEWDALGKRLAEGLVTTFGREEMMKWKENYKFPDVPEWPEEYVNRDTGKVYKPHHEDEYNFVYSDTPRYTLAKGGEGGGKALALDTPLPTPTGWTTMGNVEIGDQLFSDWGEPCNVIDISSVMHDHPCYKVVFNDDTFIVADAEHLWLTIDSKTRKSLERRGKKYTDGGKSHLPHCQPKYEPHVVTTEEIHRSILSERGFCNHAVPIAAPLALPEIELPIHPYVLGAWLGDGTSRVAQITIGYQDQEEMIANFNAAGHTLTGLNHSTTSFSIDQEIHQLRDADTGRIMRNPNSFYAKLDNLGLIGNKHIPSIYLRASYDQRLALLQGLMDTDGTIDTGGKCEYCTISEKLAEGFEELCLSLAIKVRSRLGSATCNGKTFENYRYRFTFTPYIPIFRLTRKATRISNVGRHAVRQFRRYIVAVELTDSVLVKCVTVDSPSRLFLAGKGMIPTHNSAAAIVKVLNRAKRGMSGILASNSLPHFCSSLWPEFQRWCPWDLVHATDQKKADHSWEPYRSIFNIVFTNGAVLQCGGMDDPEVWRGPNISFAMVDEVSRKKDAQVLKVLDGRVRIPGPQGESAQIIFATTPAYNWLHDYFGPLKCTCSQCRERAEIAIQCGEILKCPSCGSDDLESDDEWEAFKHDSRVITLLTKDNEDAGNLEGGYAQRRRQTLTESEARVFLEAAWENIEEGQPFLPSLIWWDQCRTEVPELDPKTPLVIGVDAASGRQVEDSDCFAIVAVSPDPENKKNACIVRYVKVWQAKRGQKIDFRGSPSNPGPERELLRLCGFTINDSGGIERTGGGYNVKCIACDPLGLDDMIQRFRRKRVCYMKEIGQNVQRVKADTSLLRMIQERRIQHDGDQVLRDHLKNADRKVDDFGHSLRIVKRERTGRIDLAVSLSQAAWVCTSLNL